MRFFILRAHYRSPLNYSDQHLDERASALDAVCIPRSKRMRMPPAPFGVERPHAERFREAMNDDFNTAEAVAVLFELANEANRDDSRDAAALLKSLGGILGSCSVTPLNFYRRPLEATGGRRSA